MKFRYDPIKEELTVTEASRIEYHQLNLWLTRHVKGYRFMPAFKRGVWDGKISYFRDGKIDMGLWRECFKAAKEVGTQFVIENKDEFPLNREVTLESVQEFCAEFFKDHKVKNKKTGEWTPFMPYNYQIETAYKILKNRYCLAEVATSGGKSLIISIVYFYTIKNINQDSKLLIIVPSITLVTQFYDGLVDFNLGENIEYDGGNKNPLDIRIEEIMSDKPRKHSGSKDPNVYIGCYQSIEKWPKGWFKQFHTVACDESHLSKAKTIMTILDRTKGTAYNRFGVSGTFPVDDSAEILTIQSVLGPIITQINADLLIKEGRISPVKIKALLLNHNDYETDEKLKLIKKSGDGALAYRLEKEYIQESEARYKFIGKIVNKCTSNTLVLFHNTDYGTRMYENLKKDFPEKDFYYIDGSISGKNREIIKKEMDLTKKDVEYTILNFGDYEIDIKSDFKILLSNGDWKMASNITSDDDIDDNFLKKLRK